MVRILYIAFISIYSFLFSSFAPVNSKAKPKKTNSNYVMLSDENDACARKIVSVKMSGVADSICYLHVNCIYSEQWDTLWPVRYWQKIISLTKDSAVVSVAATRQFLGVISTGYYDSLSLYQKIAFKDSMRQAFGLAETEPLYITAGRDWFYNPKNVAPNLKAGIAVFMEEEVDPWFAQSVLLIESPGKLQKSSVGAYGPFQLMKYVGIQFGLKINSVVDERADFTKSAHASAKLFKTICIPYAKQILESKNISYSESDLWFKLFVLHVYHAGAGNVRKVVNLLNPETGGKELILNMWRTECGGFKNASQNYSQIVLASHIRFNKDAEFFNDLAAQAEAEATSRK